MPRLAGCACHVTGCVSTAECLMILGEVGRTNIWTRRGGRRLAARREGTSVIAGSRWGGRQGVPSEHIPYSLGIWASPRGTVVSKCSWERQVEVPVWGPKRGRPGGALLLSPLSYRAILGPEDRYVCLREHKAKVT